MYVYTNFMLCVQAELVASESALEEKSWALHQSKNYRFVLFLS